MTLGLGRSCRRFRAILTTLTIINLILFSDEDDQSSFDSFLAADRLLGDYNALFNAIADPSFVHTGTGDGNVLDRNGVLASNHGGELFDLKSFLAPQTADAFFDSFTAAKVREIRSAIPVPDPGGTTVISLLILVTFVFVELCKRPSKNTVAALNPGRVNGRHPPAHC